MSEHAIQDKRQTIVDGAERVFTASGFAAARVEDIAEEAGVAKGTIYLYFRSKQELFTALVEERIQEFIADLHQSVRADQDVEEALRALLWCRVRFYTKHIGLLDAVFQSVNQLSDEAQRCLFRKRIEVQRTMVCILDAVLPPQHCIRSDVIAAVIDGTVSALVMDTVCAERPLDPEQMVENVIAVILPGLLAGSCQTG